MALSAFLCSSHPRRIDFRPSLKEKTCTTSSADPLYGDMSLDGPAGVPPTNGGNSPSILKSGMGINDPIDWHSWAAAASVIREHVGRTQKMTPMQRTVRSDCVVEESVRSTSTIGLSVDIVNGLRVW